MAARDASEGETLQGETDGLGARWVEVAEQGGGVKVRKVIKVTTIWFFSSCDDNDDEASGRQGREHIRPTIILVQNRNNYQQFQHRPMRVGPSGRDH